MRGYWRLVLNRAWQDAARPFGLDTRARVIGFLFVQVIIGVGIWIGLGFAGLDDQFWWTRGLTAAAPFLCSLLFLGVKFLSAPAAIYDEQRAEIDRLSAPKNVADRIAVFIVEGRSIRAAFAKDGDTELIARDRVKWVGVVAEFLLEHLGASYATQFLAAVGNGSGLDGRNERGNGYWAEIQGKIEALIRIMEEVRQRAHATGPKSA